MNFFNSFFTARLLRLAMALVAAITLSACAGPGPYNTISEGADGALMLKGHDPVAYFTLGKHTLGKPEIKTTHDGATYRFVSDEHKSIFAANPAKYVPQFGGFCSNGVVYGMAFGGDPDTWKIIDDKLYIFGGASSRKYFVMDEKKNLQLAEDYWSTELQHRCPTGGRMAASRKRKTSAVKPKRQTTAAKAVAKVPIDAGTALATLTQLGNATAAAFAQRFFKTGEGQYGEGDAFLGIRVPVLRAFVRDMRGAGLEVALPLLKSGWHEARAVALMLLVRLYERGDEKKR
ncbi:MAG: YHS domain-containing (seleno)protein, partial [Usitatibacteraceae bacterium]